jgi:hypothetical protein
VLDIAICLKLARNILLGVLRIALFLLSLCGLFLVPLRAVTLGELGYNVMAYVCRRHFSGMAGMDESMLPYDRYEVRYFGSLLAVHFSIKVADVAYSP